MNRLALKLGMFVVSVVAAWVMNTGSASAYTESRLMDDPIFDKVSSMSEAQIRAFINSRPTSCLAMSGAVFPEPITYWQYGPNNVDAARVIYQAAVYNEINPQVIIATLQKEQSLITRSDCLDRFTRSDGTPVVIDVRNKAMGMGCPDNGPCPAPEYAGFHQQVMKGTWTLKFAKERAVGNTNWGDNGGIPYAGPWTEGMRQTCSVVSSRCNPVPAPVYRDGLWDGGGYFGKFVRMETGATAALYRYTPHLGQAFPGIFEGWFGSTTLPSVFKASGGSTVYLYTSGYKFTIPSIGVMQDYGFDPNSITSVSQAYIDALPTPDNASGLTPGIATLVRTPSNPTVYVVTIGKKYAISSMDQFNAFGFNVANIAYLPEPFVGAMTSGGNLANFIQTPAGSAFQVSGGGKRIIFDYAKYRALNPSDAYTRVSDLVAGGLTSGAPLSDRDIMVRKTDGTVYVFVNNAYYLVPNMGVYSCWGFGGAQSTPLYTLTNDGYVASISSAATLSCLVNGGASNVYLLNRANRFTVPGSYGVAPGVSVAADIKTLAERLPDGGTLKQAVKVSGGAAVWFIEGGARKLVPSLANYNRLGLTNTSVANVESGAASSIPAAGIKLGDGQLVKSNASSDVFMVRGAGRIAYPSAERFIAFRNSWGDIETYSASDLDGGYPASGQVVKAYLSAGSPASIYLVDTNGCYLLSGGLPAEYGQDSAALVSGQSYTASLFTGLNLASCRQGTRFIMPAGGGTVYWLEGGTRRPFTSWASLVAKNGGTVPGIVELSAPNLASFTLGSAMP